MAVDRLYLGTEQVLKAFNTLGPSTNAQIAEFLQRTPNAILKGVVRYRTEGLLKKVSGAHCREGKHVITAKGLEKLAKTRRNRRPVTRAKGQSAKLKVLYTPNSIFSMAACMGLAPQPIYSQESA